MSELTDYQMGFNAGRYAERARVTQLVEAARETVTKLDDFFGSYVFPFDNFKEVEALRTALKAMEQSDD